MPFTMCSLSQYSSAFMLCVKSGFHYFDIS